MPSDSADGKRVNISVIEESGPPDTSPPENNNDNTEKKEIEITPEASTKDKMPFWVMFLAFLVGLSLGAGLIGGIFYFKSRIDKLNSLSENNSPKPTIYSTPVSDDLNTASSSASPITKPDLSKYTVQILNGSGIKGEAAKVEALLKEAGFTNIKTGNASRYDYEETEISLKKGVEVSLIETITKALEGYSTKELTTPSPTYDIFITVGSRKAKFAPSAKE